MRRDIVAVGAVLLAGCSFFTDPKPRTPAQLTALPRALTADEVRVSQAANQFTFSLFRRLSAAQPDSNVFVSPLSVSFSLGMAMNGAAGTTLDQMRAALGFGAAELAEINLGYRGLMALEGGLDPSTTFTIANSVWYQAGLPVRQSFIDVVRQTFDAEVTASPFDNTTVTAVNAWVSENTGGKIPTILDGIDPNIVMFLINAIYFKGSWRSRFDVARTADAPFQTLTGATQTVKMMHRPTTQDSIGLAYTPTVAVAELSYGNGAFVMDVILPDPGQNVNDVGAALDTTAWRSMIANLHQTRMDLFLPRLRLEYERRLNDDLQALGMQVPFDPNRADFSAMSSEGLFISFVKHKTFVRVDETGTEAAAATVTGMGVTSLPASFRVDRPFIFLIRERFSGTILFIGRIVRVEQ